MPKDVREYVPKQFESETRESQYSSNKPSRQGFTSQDADIDASIDAVLGALPVKKNIIQIIWLLLLLLLI